MSAQPGSTIADRLSEKLVASLKGELPAVGTPRSIRSKVSPPNKATPVIGVRRAGKTTYLHQLRRERLQQGIARERLPYIHFGDEPLDGIAGRHLHGLIEDYYVRYPALRGQSSVTWCFDEIEVVPGWERFVRSLLSVEKVEVLIGGTTASLLPDASDATPGSTGEIVVYPFSFEEYLRHHRLPVPQDPGSGSASQRSALERSFLEFLERGGFPQAQGTAAQDRRVLLQDLVDLALLRDIVERRHVSNVAALRSVLRQLVGSSATPFTLEKLQTGLRAQGIALSAENVRQLVQHLTDCFLVRTVHLESDPDREAHPCKAYPIDPALIPLFDRGASQAPGLETAVFLELERRGLEVTYVRTTTGREVDFLARGAGGAQELIQVCSGPLDFGSIERELQALLEIGQAYPHATKRLLTPTRAAIPGKLPVGLSAQPAYEWLLSKSG
jgi:predicted AAA+ superfamily ATPase